jgi:putative transposase
LSSAITHGDKNVTIKLAAPKPYKKGLGKLKKLQRSVSRKRYQSRSWYKAKEKLAAYHYRIDCRRSDWQHKTTTSLAKQYELMYLEDLNTKGMMKNHCLAGALADVAFGEIRRQLEYKTNVLYVGRFFPSTKKCNCCNHVQEVALSEREWTCEKCGVEHDRDVNAKNNIYDEGERLRLEIEADYRKVLPSLVAAKVKYSRYEKI